MAETASLLGLGHSITFDGKTYPIAGPEYEYLGEFELWLENRALEKIERQKGKVPDDVYNARHDAMIKHIGAQAYSRGSPEFLAALNTFDGQQELMFILMRARDAGVTRELVGQMFKERYKEMMGRVLLASQEAQVKDVPPKAQTAATSPSPPSAPSSATAAISPATSGA